MKQKCWRFRAFSHEGHLSHWRLHVSLSDRRARRPVARAHARALLLAHAYAFSCWPSAYTSPSPPCALRRSRHADHVSLSESTAAQTQKDTARVTASAASTWLWASSSTPRWKARGGRHALSRKTPTLSLSLRSLSPLASRAPTALARSLARSLSLHIQSSARAERGAFFALTRATGLCAHLTVTHSSAPTRARNPVTQRAKPRLKTLRTCIRSFGDRTDVR